MQNHSKTKHISKNNHSNPHKNKKPYRPQFNNNNPNNMLDLNKYHQIQTNPDQANNKSESFKLHKRKRDLERIIKHCQQKGIEVDPAKKQELEKITSDMGGRRKTYQKNKRKQFFLEQKYKDIKSIELRKVYKHLGTTKANTKLSEEEKRNQIEEWEKKLRYIKHFPKTLKYISLFPTSKPLEQKTLQFQKKIMADIEEQNSKRVARLNFYKSQNEVSTKKGKKGQQQGEQTKGKKQSIVPLTTREIKTKKGKISRQVVDDFFVQQQESEGEKIDQQRDEQNQSEQESELDKDVQVDDEDEMDDEQDDEQDDE